MPKMRLLIVIFLFTTSCGYEAMYSEKRIGRYDFKINNIILEGDRDINIRIQQKLINYTLNINKVNKIFDLKINSTSNKTILAKNIQGDPTSFKNTTIVYVDVMENGKTKNNLQFEKNFKYNNESNKFELKRYERELKNNLAEAITNELTFKLSNIK